ncbi:3-deoxy-7-phosphoheptulonate synthase [Solimicrobium silvestre]|uniref:Phospho-2-dehydro-3-deoxyheptonate aldolase n=1 Tax=Solimicrobium silvestre TaxID=2099400 RepID=A0A2S9H2S5_9BURK|nr:3-deoxy-7-phosphoheptulonate synthase class II [Solimicrobium silvestre]PRC94281.1 3-deoxy-D-arabino-heptulosonate 7-phosphate (DAHP) synthase [Solimicrobium silvestre]
MFSNRTPWSPSSWQSMSQRQLPHYQDDAALQQVLARIQSYPRLVAISEIRRLTSRMARVAHGRGFILQGGDCAESFSDFCPKIIRQHYHLLQQMAAMIGAASHQPVVRIGRIAGQYAKPRSSAMECVAGQELPSYRGDMINGAEFQEQARQTDPLRMETAYFKAAGSLNYLRSLNSEANASRAGSYFTSHEALLLPYEQSMLEQDAMGNWYCGSGHFLWIGERTRALDGAHVEFLRGVCNPIGVKLGPTVSREELIRLIDVLNPFNEAGRLTLIVRNGAAHIDRLPKLLEAIQLEGREVLWMCDPMHGNGIQTADGIKTRDFASIQAELNGFLDAHRKIGTHPGGVHLELTGLNVSECLGGPSKVSEADLATGYLSACDPRLNPEQAMALTATLVNQLGLASERATSPIAPKAQVGLPAVHAQHLDWESRV